MTREELIRKLRALARNHQDLSSDPELLAECRKLGLVNIDTTHPEKVADFIEKTPVIEPVIEKKMGPKALSSQDLRVILEEFDKNRGLKSAETLTIAVQKNPLLKNIDSSEILRIIERKIELEVEEEKERADRKEIDEISDKRIEIEEKLRTEVPPTTNEEELEKTAKRVVEITRENNDLGSCREKSETLFKEIKSDSKEYREAIIETAVGEMADKIVKEKTTEVAKALTDELKGFELTAKQRDDIQEVVEERIRAKVDNPAEEIGENKAEVIESSGKKTIETGKNLTEEISEILGSKASENKPKIEVAVKNAELNVKQQLFSGEINKDSPVDVVRGQKLEAEVVSRMTETGATIKEARSTAKMVRELSFSPKESSNSTATIQAINTLETNGYHSGDNSRFAEQAGMVRNLIRSPIRINENINKILNLGNKLDGIKGFDQWKTIAKTLKGNPAMTRSLQWVQNLNKFQGFIGNIGGWLTNPVGQLLKVPALQDFALRIATRLGGETVGAMATQLAGFGLKGGLEKIIGQLFAKGTVSAIEAGAAVAADVGTGGLAVIVQLGIAILGKLKGAAEKTLEAIGLGSAKLKNSLKETFGGLVGTFLYWAGTAAMGLIAMAGMVVVPVALVITSVFITVGGITVILPATAALVSSWVAPRGTGGNCTQITPSPAPSGSINCDQNAPENTLGNVDKANYVDVANRWQAGTNYSSQCFNDTVNRALCSGINPTYALWAWLHESGASNYTGRSDIEDFGMHSIPQNEDFNAQITAFLKLDPATGCIGDSRIGGDYWLAFSANYLNGSNCDPDHPNSITKMTPRQYEAELKKTWSWVSSSPMPSSIHVAIAGKNCDQIGKSTSSSTSSSDGSYTYTDDDGNMWQCTGTPIGGGGGSQVPAEPIYDDACVESPAYCVVKYLLGNGVDTVKKANVVAVAKLIDQWKNAPASFNKGNFNSAMIASATTVPPEYVFQCVGFAVAVNPKIGATSWGGDSSSWESMISNGSTGCPRIVNSGAGVGDFILFPVGSWYHIQVISQLRSDGSYTISQSNWGGPGRLSNVEGSDIQSYLRGDTDNIPKSVLRCN